MASTGSDQREDSREYLFHEQSPGVFVRKCYGHEELTALSEDVADGTPHQYIGTAVKFPSTGSNISATVLRSCARSAWTQVRLRTPAIAFRTYRESTGDQRYGFRYTVPKSQGDVNDWLNQTVFVNEEPVDFYKKNRTLIDNQWWRSSEEKYVMELHVTPIPSEDNLQWSFHVTSLHPGSDARSVLAMLDTFFFFLTKELANPTESSSVNEWGTETSRLPPPGAFVHALAETQSPPSFDALSAVLAKTNPEASQPKAPWLFPTSVFDEEDKNKGMGRIAILPEDMTTRLYAAARAHGTTVGHVLTALSVLAHVETMIGSAAIEGEARFEQLASLFSKAAEYFVGNVSFEQRPNFPEEYKSYDSAHPPALCTVDGAPMILSMDDVRACFELAPNEKPAAPQRVKDANVFWNRITRASSDSWKAMDRSLDAYAVREHGLHMSFTTILEKMAGFFTMPILMFTSIGDLGRLGLFSSFTPSAASAQDKSKLEVTAVTMGVRQNGPSSIVHYWTFRGRLNCQFVGSKKFVRPETLDQMADAFVEWIRIAIGDDGKGKELGIEKVWT